ncbi:MAG TPA: hypothetical protein VE732_00240 [Nitrososphaera sp.]|nr:hypothetical protein [Nitrososphaera sp.]
MELIENDPWWKEVLGEFDRQLMLKSLEGVVSDSHKSAAVGALLEQLQRRDWIEKILENKASPRSLPESISVWQLFKGLPERDEHGRPIAVERRRIAQQALDRFPDLEFFYEMEANGDMIFVRPMAAQRSLSEFNYSFRDYLNGPKETKATTLSDSFISKVSRSTQAITVSTPVFDKTRKVAKLVCASVSNHTIREKVFQQLLIPIGISERTEFYFIDRYGHIVASSSTYIDYTPTKNARTDESDVGNFRTYGPLTKINWVDEDFEKNTDWQRLSRTWVTSSLRSSYSAEYISQTGEHVLGTFYPISLIDGRPSRYGLLIETPITVIHHSQRQLNIILTCVGLVMLLILLFFGRMIRIGHQQIAQELADKDKQLRDISAQVAHDVRSPLLALQTILPRIESQPEHIRITYRTTLNRIQDLANDLIDSTGQPPNKTKGS